MLRIVRAFVKIHVINEFRDQKMQISVTLPVGVTNHIDRHAVHCYPDISAVVYVKPTQINLFCFATSGVLGGE